MDLQRGVGLNQEMYAVAYCTAAGGGKGDDGLSFQCSLLYKGLDDTRGQVPPDGEAQIKGVVSAHVRRWFCHGGARFGVCHLHAAARLLVAPVEVGRGVGFGGHYLKQVRTGQFGYLLRHGARCARGGEVRHQCLCLHCCVLICKS